MINDLNEIFAEAGTPQQRRVVPDVLISITPGLEIDFEASELEPLKEGDVLVSDTGLKTVILHTSNLPKLFVRAFQ